MHRARGGRDICTLTGSETERAHRCTVTGCVCVLCATSCKHLTADGLVIGHGSSSRHNSSTITLLNLARAAV